MMKNKNKLILLQIVLGVVFLAQPIILPVRPDSLDRFVFTDDVIKNLFANMLILAFFYLNYFVLIPKFYFKRRYFYYLSAIFVCFVSILFFSSTLFVKNLRKENDFLISTNLEHRKKPPIHEENHNLPPKQFFDFNNKPLEKKSLITRARFFFTENDQIFFLFASIVLFSLFLKINSRYYKIENAKKETEINLLLAQINPHFLFNALNSIYSLTIKENAPNSSSSLLKLSGILRYIITETNQSFVSLDKEINSIVNFVDLQQLRLTGVTNVTCLVLGDILNKNISPMLLIPFIENAFKYGVNPDEPSNIEILIDVTLSNLTMKVSNDIVTKSKDEVVWKRTGIGIANVKKRLSLLYPDKHKLFISENENFFNVELNIEL